MRFQDLEAPPESSGLSLAVERQGLGLELRAPVVLGPLRVTLLHSTVPGITFPVDVSGGVSKFRHRRGVLSRMQCEVYLRDLERWMAPKLAGIVSSGVPEVTLTFEDEGVGVSLQSREAKEGLLRGKVPVVLAFHLALVADHEGLMMVVERARATETLKPATLRAMQVMQALLASYGERSGCAFVLGTLSERIARHIFPLFGARAPETENIRVTRMFAAHDAMVLDFARGPASELPSPRSLAARETAQLLCEADEALFVQDFDTARTLLLRALERAPKLQEALRRIAELDAAAQESRAEAALATLDAVELPVGSLRAVLSQGARFESSALASLRAEAAREPGAALSAVLLYQAALLDPTSSETLDQCIATCPSLTAAHWLRLERTLKRGESGTVDAEYLEALARGVHERFTVLQRLGDAYAAAGHAAQAGRAYERALRYIPDSAEALFGLGEALLATGRPTRGIELLVQAIDLWQREPKDASAAVLALAQALVTHTNNISLAVARLSGIPDDSSVAVRARALEGQLRRDVGDSVGASLAYARMRELARQRHDRDAVPWLLEAARMEESIDTKAAERHRALAALLAPEVAVKPVAQPVTALQAPGLTDASGHTAPEAQQRHPMAFLDDEVPEDEGPETHVPHDAEARIETLKKRLEAEPSDERVATELADLLEATGATMELLALTSSNIEAPDDAKRERWLPRHRGVLLALEREARSQGRAMEADLYRDAAAGLI